MVTEKTTLVISLEDNDAKNFKDMVRQLSGGSIGFTGIHNHLNKEQVKLLSKLDKKLNPKKDEEN